MYVGIRADEDRSGIRLDEAEHQDRPARSRTTASTSTASTASSTRAGSACRPTTTGGRGRAATSASSSGRPSGSGCWRSTRTCSRLAKQYEKIDDDTGERYTWNQKESLEELADPERVQEIKERHQKALETKQKRRSNLPLVEVLDEVLEDENDDEPCLFCHT